MSQFGLLTKAKRSNKPKPTEYDKIKDMLVKEEKNPTLLTKLTNFD